MRGLFTFFLGLTCLSFVWGGGGGIYVALTNPHPTTMTCADYIHGGGAKQWLALSECRLGLEKFGSVKDEKGRVEAFYAPLLPVNEPDARSSILIRATARKDLTDRLFDTEFSGLVQFGIANNSKVREALTGGGLDMAREFVILELGKKPVLGLSATMFALGLLLGWWCYRRIRRKVLKHSFDDHTPASLGGDDGDPPMAEPVYEKESVPEPVSW